MRTVIKRDGSEVRFNGEKIKRAILNAMLETTEGMDEKLAGDIAQAIEKQVEKSQRTVNPGSGGGFSDGQRAQGRCKEVHHLSI